ncbi:MAG: Lin0512 family protein [Candidatus Helarchaeota archaeon]|nr:Lin0512 family protein [Candidatus Helarchaeota archaeon]
MKDKDLKKFVIQIGMGVDQHGQDATKAAQKAIKDAISNNCLVGLTEICHLQQLEDFYVHILIAVPYPEQVNEKRVLKAVPFGNKELVVEKGGMVVPGIRIPELGDTSNEMIIANAAVTVLVKKKEN